MLVTRKIIYVNKQVQGAILGSLRLVSVRFSWFLFLPNFSLLKKSPGPWLLAYVLGSSWVHKPEKSFEFAVFFMCNATPTVIYPFVHAFVVLGHIMGLELAQRQAEKLQAARTNSRAAYASFAALHNNLVPPATQRREKWGEVLVRNLGGWNQKCHIFFLG